MYGSAISRIPDPFNSTLVDPTDATAVMLDCACASWDMFNRNMPAAALRIRRDAFVVMAVCFSYKDDGIVPHKVS